jgi:hypothetical protein
MGAAQRRVQARAARAAALGPEGATGAGGSCARTGRRRGGSHEGVARSGEKASSVGVRAVQRSARAAGCQVKRWVGRGGRMEAANCSRHALGVTAGRDKAGGVHRAGPPTRAVKLGSWCQQQSRSYVHERVLHHPKICRHNAPVIHTVPSNAALSSLPRARGGSAWCNEPARRARPTRPRVCPARRGVPTVRGGRSTSPRVLYFSSAQPHWMSLRSPPLPLAARIPPQRARRVNVACRGRGAHPAGPPRPRAPHAGADQVCAGGAAARGWRCHGRLATWAWRAARTPQVPPTRVNHHHHLPRTPKRRDTPQPPAFVRMQF